MNINISRISRSIVVAIFVICIIFLMFLDVLNIIKPNTGSTNSVISVLVKIGFAILVISLVLIYMCIKDKLYKMHVKRKISIIYRYVYIGIVIIASSLINLVLNKSNNSDNMILFYIISNIAISIIIKRIVFNVSKSDMLSVLGMFVYALFPKNILDSIAYISSTIFTFTFLMSLLLLQYLIDELKQKDIKTKKYIIESIIYGIFCGISIFMGINIFIFIALELCLIFITYNLDNTHISFPNKFMRKLTQEKRESLYKIERININKLFVIIVISLLVMTIFSMLIYQIFIHFNNNVNIAKAIEIINTNKEYSKNFSISYIYNTLLNNSRNLVSTSSIFYIVLFIYILFMEVLAFFLHRRYDTKSTVMKLIFILIIASMSIFNVNVYYFQPLFMILLILIAIVNTSNIYLNREERIKLLVS